MKWDGFRALVRTGDGFRVRSRRGWDMTALVPELRALPPGLVLDGELVSIVDGLPYFCAVCARLLHRVEDVVLTYIVFDVLAADGRSLVDLPYVERRERLEAPSLCVVNERLDDGCHLVGRCRRAGARGRRRETPLLALPAGRSVGRLVEAEEPRDMVVGRAGSAAVAERRECAEALPGWLGTRRFITSNPSLTLQV